jgi:hypothetical protein
VKRSYAVRFPQMRSRISEANPQRRQRPPLARDFGLIIRGKLAGHVLFIATMKPLTSAAAGENWHDRAVDA